MRTINKLRPSRMLILSALIIMILSDAVQCSRPFPDDDFALYMTLATALREQDRYIFISSVTSNGNIGGIAAADAICNRDANNPAPQFYFKALIVDGNNRTACVNSNCSPFNSGDRRDWVLRSERTYYRSSGYAMIPVLTTDANAIIDLSANPLLNGGFSATNLEYWTGLNTDWTTGAASTGHCNSWQDSGVIPTGSTGFGDQTGTGAIGAGNPSCSLTAHILCIQQ